MRTVKRHWINVYLYGVVQNLYVTDAEERRIYKAKMKEIEAQARREQKEKERQNKRFPAHKTA